jgi:hypothetical protein
METVHTSEMLVYSNETTSQKTLNFKYAKFIVTAPTQKLGTFHATDLHKSISRIDLQKLFTRRLRLSGILHMTLLYL